LQPNPALKGRAKVIPPLRGEIVANATGPVRLREDPGLERPGYIQSSLAATPDAACR